jgi:DR2241 stabilising domain/4Fe-4S iron-sulfur cluster binding domain
MATFENPAYKAFASELGERPLFAQVIIRRAGKGFELRHADDAEAADGKLRDIAVPEARALAQRTATGEFRPLKSAPTLQSGWRMLAGNDADLATALDHLYPGALADWHAARTNPPPVTNYVEFAGRQSGMYRITATVGDPHIGRVVRHTCYPEHCLKRRLWDAIGEPPDSTGIKSPIPCLEPCAMLLEAARKAASALARRETGSFAACADPEVD